MDMPLCNIGREAEPAFHSFLEESNKQKTTNQNCDLIKHKCWKNVFHPVGVTLQTKLDDFNIVTGGPNADTMVTSLIIDNKEENSLQDNVENDDNVDEFNDFVLALRENLETQKCISPALYKEMLRLSHDTIRKVFIQVSSLPLQSEQVYDCGIFLVTESKDHECMIPLFLTNLLFPKLKEKFCPTLLLLLEDISQRQPLIFQQEMVKLLKVEEDLDIVIQYLKRLSLTYQSTILHDLVSVEKLKLHQIPVIEQLLNKETEPRTLNNLVKLVLTNVAQDYGTDKDFGKLVFTTISLLGRAQIVELEQPLSHIIFSHKSIWRAKLLKLFRTRHENSMLSQSQRRF